METSWTEPVTGEVHVLLGENDALITRWRRDMRHRGLLSSTIEDRTRRMQLFARWLGRPLGSAARENVEAFLDSRRGRYTSQLGARARYRWVSDLHVFYLWMITEGLADEDPTLRVQRPRLRLGLPRPIPDANLQFALDGADRRMRAMLLLAHLEGARVMEIAALAREDVLEAYDPPVILLHGKGDKDRLVPLHADVLDALTHVPLPRSGPVFLRDGQPMTGQQVSHEINGYLHDLGIADTAHSLRHWFGTRFYGNTKDLRATQEMMGHSSPSTTAVYTKWSMDDAAAGIRSLRSPGGRLGADGRVYPHQGGQPPIEPAAVMQEGDTDRYLGDRLPGLDQLPGGDA